MLISLEEARKLIDENFKFNENLITYENIYSSVGKIVLEDIYARKSIPEFNLSAMDGFAFNISDYKKFGKLKIVGKLFPSSKNVPTLNEGEAYYVTTGSPIPKGANAVVRIEACKVVNNELYIGENVYEGKDIVYAGEDIKEGELILKKGEILTPYHLGILTQQGIKKVKVGNIKSCIIASGDEIAPFTEANNENLIPDSISPVLIPLLEKLGKPLYLGVVNDNLERIKETLLKVKDNCDIIFFIGGSSVGEKDYVKKVINEIGNLLFEGVNVNIIKRGGVGKLNDIPIVSLPGRIVSALTVFHEHGLHIISRLVGIEIRKFIKAKLSSDLVVKHKMDSTYLFKIQNEFAYPLRWGTGLYSEIAKADGFGYLKRETTYKRGEEIEIQKFL